MVGMTGFEPATPCPPDKCATGLRYIPIWQKLPGATEVGRSERIRTFDPLAPNQVHYQAVLRSVLKKAMPLIGSKKR